MSLLERSGAISLAGNTQYLRQGFEHTTSSVSDVATAFYSGLWAYDGWNNLNYVTEEIKNPSRSVRHAPQLATGRHAPSGEGALVGDGSGEPIVNNKMFALLPDGGSLERASKLFEISSVHFVFVPEIARVPLLILLGTIFSNSIFLRYLFG